MNDDALDRIREMRDHTEALELALAEIKTATREPKTTLRYGLAKRFDEINCTSAK